MVDQLRLKTLGLTITPTIFVRTTSPLGVSPHSVPLLIGTCSTVQDALSQHLKSFSNTMERQITATNGSLLRSTGSPLHLRMETLTLARPVMNLVLVRFLADHVFLVLTRISLWGHCTLAPFRGHRKGYRQLKHLHGGHS